MHKISSHCKFVSVTEWHCVQPSYGEPKLNGFLHFWGDVGECGCGYWLVSSQGNCKQYSMTSMHTAVCISITQKASK